MRSLRGRQAGHACKALAHRGHSASVPILRRELLSNGGRVACGAAVVSDRPTAIQTPLSSSDEPILAKRVARSRTIMIAVDGTDVCAQGVQWLMREVARAGAPNHARNRSLSASEPQCVAGIAVLCCSWKIRVGTSKTVSGHTTTRNTQLVVVAQICRTCTLHVI